MTAIGNDAELAEIKLEDQVSTIITSKGELTQGNCTAEENSIPEDDLLVTNDESSSLGIMVFVYIILVY